MNTAERMRSQILACGAREIDASTCESDYATALATNAPSDWKTFYRAVYRALDNIRSGSYALDVFAKMEIADVVRLLQDDLGEALFEASAVAALADDLLYKASSVAM